MKVGVISLGCPKNLTDTEAILGLLVDSGYDITNNQNEAEIMIVNTCAFIGDARDEAFGIIKEMSKLKARGRLKFLVVAGCLPKRYKNDLFDKFEEIDAIIGPGQIDRIIHLIKDLGKQKKISMLEGTHCLFTHKTPKLKATPQHYAYIKIADGCNNRCSYCIVPSLRGKYQSRPMGSIVSEVKDLVKKGLKEAILVAQDTTMYGTDIYGKPSLHILCKKLAGIRGLKWIRIMYAHPAHVTDELIETMAKEPKICRYLDLPIQHSCDRILRSMKRRISAEQLIRVIEKLRRKIPGIAIRTSVIVGFPGETGSDFNKLMAFIREERFERLGVFKYSRESGTPAAKMGDQIGERIKDRRFHKLMRLQREISAKSLKNMVGKIIEVLAEGSIGRSYMDAPDIDGVVKLNKCVPNGKMVQVKITGSGPYDLSGILVT
jgi:ribosomal protein S12 methylthiotransferase